MKFYLAYSFFFIFSHSLFAQEALVFSQAKIVSNTLQAVPANKVWKVTSIYGSEFVSECYSWNNDYLGLKCDQCWRDNPNGGIHTVALNYFRTSFLVNAVNIVHQVSALGIATTRSTSNCTGGTFCNSNFSCANKSPNPNLLPMWLPAGTTLQSGGSNTFLSVLEFTIQ